MRRWRKRCSRRRSWRTWSKDRKRKRESVLHFNRSTTCKARWKWRLN